MKRKRMASAGFAALCLWAQAATYTWTGAAGDGKWSTPANWENNQKPVSASDSIIIIKTQPGASACVNDIAGNFSFKRLVFAAGSADVKLSGKSLFPRTYCLRTTMAPGEDSLSFDCQAAGVTVEIANDIYLTGERASRHAAHSDFVFSGTFSGSSDGKGFLSSHVANGSPCARLTFKGASTLTGPATDGNDAGIAFAFRSGTNVIARGASFPLASGLAFDKTGTVVVFEGGAYAPNLRYSGNVTVTNVFLADTTLNGRLYSPVNSEVVLCVQGAQEIVFDSPVAMAGSKLRFRGQGPAAFRFKEGVACNVFDWQNAVSATHYDFYVGGNYNGGNTVTDYYFQYSNLHAAKENILSPSAVLRWGYYANNSYGVFHLNGFDQTIDRFTGKNAGSHAASGRLITTDKPARLTLAASASDWCQNRLSGPLTLVYHAKDAAYVQSLCTNAYEATGDIVVTKGTLRLTGPATYRNASALRIGAEGRFENASTKPQALGNVPLVEIAAGGVFCQKTGAAYPFVALSTVFRLEAGAKIELEEAVPFALNDLYVDGVRMPYGHYQALEGQDPEAEKVAWLAGSGVCVCTPITHWRQAADGDWHADGNWTDGKPNSTRVAQIKASGASYAVSVGADTGVLTNLVVGNDASHTTLLDVQAKMTFDDALFTLEQGAHVRVNEGGEIVHAKDETPWTTEALYRSPLQMHPGSQFTVAGGSVLFTNYVGRMHLAGTSGQPCTLKVTSGTFAFHPANTVFSRICLDAGSSLEVEGGRFFLGTGTASYNYPPLEQKGGRIHVSGTGVFELDYLCAHIFGTGETRFSDDAVFSAEKRGDNAGVEFFAAPTTAGGESRIVFEDRAHFWTEKYATLSLFQLGYDVADLREPALPQRLGGKAVFEHNAAAHSRFGSKIAIGSDYCRGEAYLRSGLVSVWYLGMDVGGYSPKGSAARADAHGEGLLEVDGGALYIETLLANTAARAKKLDGLIVGAGWNTLPGSASFYRGRVALKSGAITNAANGNVVVVGAGQAAGEIVQTGGAFVHLPTNTATRVRPVVLGFEGGSGLYALSNGTVHVASDVYVGGVPTNTLGVYLADTCPHRSTAQGRLVLANGQMTVEGNLILSADGTGTLEMGSGASLAAQDLVLGNAPAGLAPSTLSFAMSGNGAGKVALGGTFSVGDAAQLNVDLGAYDGSKSSLALLSCAHMEGRFDASRITLQSDDEVLLRMAKIIQHDKGLRLVISRGTVMTLR